MRDFVRRLDRIERAAGAASNPIDAIHFHFFAPSNCGPVLVGAYGPIFPGKQDVRPARLNREMNEAEADFLRRAEAAFRRPRWKIK